MAATYYAQILRDFEWFHIVHDIAYAAKMLREQIALGITDGAVEYGYACAGLDTEGSPVASAFVGTVFNLTPSGKYYTPWANSNVTVAEARADERYWEAFDRVCDKYGLVRESGEGDPCDVFVGRTVEVQ